MTTKSEYVTVLRRDLEEFLMKTYQSPDLNYSLVKKIMVALIRNEPRYLLVSRGPTLIPVIKILRSMTYCSLKEAKSILDNIHIFEPFELKVSDKCEYSIEHYIALLEEAGCLVSRC